MIFQRQLRKRLPLFFIKVCTKSEFYDIITMYMCNYENLLKEIDKGG